jgi:alkylation response protein AidB-like acyl-CoA dehydrogenase
MDWTPTEMMEAAAELTQQVMAAPDPWAALVEAELTELTDMLDVASVLIEVGRAGGHAPALPLMVLGAPARHFGELPSGGTATGALVGEPLTVDDGALSGVCVCVPAAHVATHVVVRAVDGVYLVAIADCGVESYPGTDGDPLATLALQGVHGQRLGGDEVLAWWLPRVHLGIAALQLGLSRRALELTAAYTKERKQFGRPIGTFQAVQHRAADAWIDLSAMEVSMLQAAWRLDAGLDARREVLIARWWASQGSHRTVAAAQHLHGGMGFDKDYPLYRYFLCSKQWETLLGGASAQLEELGALL